MSRTETSQIKGPPDKGRPFGMGGMLGRAVRFGLCVAVLAGLLGILFSLAGRWSPVADRLRIFGIS